MTSNLSKSSVCVMDDNQRFNSSGTGMQTLVTHAPVIVFYESIFIVTSTHACIAA